MTVRISNGEATGLPLPDSGGNTPGRSRAAEPSPTFGAESAPTLMAASQSARAVVSVRPDLTAELMANTGLDEASLDCLVRNFYIRVRSDELLGPIFAASVTDWEPHLERMVAFWSSVALMTGRYHGRPMQKHMSLAIGPEHFQRWLDLFRDTAHQLLTPAGAAHVIAKAEQIAAAMQARSVPT